MSQNDWKWCYRCQGLFFGGNISQSVCPATGTGGPHDDTGSWNYAIATAGSGQPDWKWCNKCQGLFYAGNNTLGACPVHSHDDTGSSDYVLSTSGGGQPGWKWCNQCQGLWFDGGGVAAGGSCPATGGPHTDGGSGDYDLSISGPGQPGWKWCHQCQGLFFAGGATLGTCPATGGPHNVSCSYNYDLSTSGPGQPGWRWCNQCQGLFFAGGDTLGVCPVNSHNDAGSGNYVLNTSGGQPGWRWCDQCQGLWYAGGPSQGFCPATGIEGHNVAGSSNYALFSLGSNSNYIMYNDCNNLIGVSVTINVTEDMVFESATGPAGPGQPTNAEGFAFQLNAYSAQGYTTVWQQYCLILWNYNLTGQINNWTANGAIIDYISPALTNTPLPSVTIPAGYQLSIILGSLSANINAVTFKVIDNRGQQVVNVTYKLLDDTTNAGAPVTVADLAPIVAFELNIVGQQNGAIAVLSSGAGTITYTASEGLTALTQEPACTDSTAFTEEQANTFYGVLAEDTPSNAFTQPFNVSAQAAIPPV